ncbi:MAG TPA: DUF3037 domain-containing protein [Anaerolineae bacterium]
MPALCSFDYAVVRVVPRVEREEFFNAGVIVLCRARRFLAAAVHLDRGRLALLAPEADPDAIQAHLDLIPLICAGGAPAGELAELSQVERFRWLISPRSTVIQVSASHAGLCVDPAATLAQLMARIVGCE